jgi:hypothetical protein
MQTVTSQAQLRKLSETDFYLWLETMADLLQKQNFHELDLENLMAEIRDMGRNSKRELENRLIVLIMHLLKWKYQPQRQSNSWRYPIVEQRHQIKKLLEYSPSLKPYLQKILPKCYQDARQDASLETLLELTTFPVNNPFIVEQIIEPDFWPES